MTATAMHRPLPTTARDVLVFSYLDAAAKRAAQRGQQRVKLPVNLKSLLHAALLPPGTPQHREMTVHTRYGDIQVH